MDSRFSNYSLCLPARLRLDEPNQNTRIRDVVKALRESGAIDELTTAVHEAMIAARDTTREIKLL